MLKIWDYLANGPYPDVATYKATLRSQSSSFDPILFTIRSNETGLAPCAIIENQLYYFGGRETGRHNGLDYDALFGHTIGDVDVYDCKAGTWSTHA